MLELFKEAGYESNPGPDPVSDVYIINTCTVTNLSDRKSRQFIRRCKKANPQAIVAVVGCYSQTSPEKVKDMEGVDLILGTKDRDKIVSYVEEIREKKNKIIHVTDSGKHQDFEDFKIKNQQDHTRAYVKIQDGCNQYCSYCIIPYARGPIRSRDPEETLKEIQDLVDHGYQEIILTGIHVASYGLDLGNIRLIDLIEKISGIENLKRIRLSSVDPRIVTDDFIKRLAETGKVCDHFHLSMQHASNKILKTMNRKYTQEDFYEKAEIIRKHMPYAGITTDCIVGFPTETEEDFMILEDFVKKVGFSRIHVFQYSPRQGTKAAEMPQVDQQLKHQRSKRLIETGQKLALDFIEKNFSRDLEVLFEKEVEGVYQGYTSNYIRVACKSKKNLTNKILHGTITDKMLEPVNFKIRS